MRSRSSCARLSRDEPLSDACSACLFALHLYICTRVDPSAASLLPSPSSGAVSTAARPITPLQAYLTRQLHKYNHLVGTAHHKIYTDISALKESILTNIDAVLERGEKIDLLVDRTDALSEQSFVFHSGARKLRDAMWWKNTRMLIAIGGIGTVSRGRES
jgi:hypothetical protein